MWRKRFAVGQLTSPQRSSLDLREVSKHSPTPSLFGAFNNEGIVFGGANHNSGTRHQLPRFPRDFYSVKNRHAEIEDGNVRRARGMHSKANLPFSAVDTTSNSVSSKETRWRNMDDISSATTTRSFTIFHCFLQK